MNAFKYLCLYLPFILVACGGDSNTSKPEKQQAPDYSHLNQASLDPTPLRQASATELEQLLKNGLRLSLDNTSYAQLINTTALAGAVESKDNSGKFSGNHFSNTNVQVAGVDEADFVKYDGTHIYLTTPVEHTDEASTSRLKVFATDPASATATLESEVPLDHSQWGNVSELYLVKDNNQEETAALAILRRSWSFINFNSILAEDGVGSNRISLPYPQEGGIDVTLYDVTNYATPTEAWSISLDGDLLGSRKIGNLLYLVSSFVPTLYPLNYNATTDEQRVTNENLIRQVTVNKLLPEYRINQGAAQPLNNSTECLLPAKTNETSGHLNLINITAIDLTNRQIIESVCVNTLVQGIYASPTHIYLGGSDNTRWNNAHGLSVIHKFSLSADGVDYEATGALKGSIGWSSPSFRMDEHHGDLRVVTTTYNDNFVPLHHLSILRQVAGQQTLTTLAQLPNDNRPQPIGKPNEDIYAVRFNGDKAYVVTFERVDPLYVLDLSNPEDPLVAGELEIPGFSTYLHPVDESYLFALGQDANSDGQQTGIKVALFDIRNPAQPMLVNSVSFGETDSFSEAGYDHRALSFLRKNDDQLRITLPITLYTSAAPGELTGTNWLNTDLQQFEINGLAGSAANITHTGTIKGENNTTLDYPLWGNNRGILHDNAVFYIHGFGVIGSLW